MALFPLGTVLLPGAVLSLRIFEPRYLDLVRACCRDDTGFGICAILDGHEVGAPATPVALGTEARIVDFTSLPDGLLGISVKGTRRFRVQRTRVRDNGLILADVDWLPPTASTPLAIEHELLATMLQRLIEHIGGTHAKATKENYRDADWVSWRLAELLPITLPQRQALLQEDDAQRRMQRLLELVATLLPE
jgi:Lon protease-like protein